MRERSKRSPQFSIAKRFLPEVETLHGLQRTLSVGSVIGLLYAAPLALVGLVWLVCVTDLALLRTAWPTLLLLFVLLFILEHLDFFIFVEVTPGTYADWKWSLWSVVTWSTALIYGPTALWPSLIWRSIMFARQWRKATTPEWRWNLGRNLALHFATVAPAALLALLAYTHWGGVFPLPGLSLSHILPAFGATLVWLLLVALLWLPLMNYFAAAPEFAWTGSVFETTLRFVGITMGWRLFVDPFAILAAGLYTEHGLGGYLFFISALLLCSLLAHQLSQAITRSQLRSRELEKLERLGRALLRISPDISALPDVLREYVAMIFPFSHIQIHTFSEGTLLHHPDDGSPVKSAVWTWMRAMDKGCAFHKGSDLPWGGHLDENRALVLVPIMDVEEATPIGGIYLVRFRDLDTIDSLLPAVQSLAA